MFFKNQIDIEGRLTREPELKTSTRGTPYCRFSIAYNQARKNKSSGEWENIAHYFNCVTFNKMAESIATFHKGDPLTLSGILQYNSYEKNGEKRNEVSILVNDCKKLYIEKKTGEGKYSKSSYKKSEPVTEPVEDDLAVTLDVEENPFPDDIPFW